MGRTDTLRAPTLSSRTDSHEACLRRKSWIEATFPLTKWMGAPEDLFSRRGIRRALVWLLASVPWIPDSPISWKLARMSALSVLPPTTPALSTRSTANLATTAPRQLPWQNLNSVRPIQSSPNWTMAALNRLAQPLPVRRRWQMMRVKRRATRLLQGCLLTRQARGSISACLTLRKRR